MEPLVFPAQSDIPLHSPPQFVTSHCTEAAVGPGSPAVGDSPGTTESGLGTAANQIPHKQQK